MNQAQASGRIQFPKITVDRQTVLNQYKNYLNTGYGQLAEVMGLPVEVYSEGAMVFDENGNEYLDCGGYGVFIMGHRHPVVIDAVRQQLDRHPMATRTFLNAEMGSAAEVLVKAAPKGIEKVFFVNSGAEATELGLKLAKLSGKTRLISTKGGFHGKTCGALSVTGKAGFREPFGALLPNVEFIEYGSLEALQAALCNFKGDAIVIVEPVQGEAGVIIPPSGYLLGVRQLCDQFAATMIVDEIQTGLGRLGHFWGVDQEGVCPDLMLVGKALSGGVVPCGAVLGKPEYFDPLDKDPLLHSSTFAGTPLAMAAAKASIEVIRSEMLPKRAQLLGEKLMLGLRNTFGFHCNRMVKDIRGKGLMIAMEFHESHHAWDCMLRMIEHRVIMSTSLNQHHTIRFTPPAIFSERELGWFMHACWKASIQLKHAWKN